MTRRQRPVKNWRRRWKDGWKADPARARRGAMLDMLLFDHGLLRMAWRNLHEIDAGVWRSNQPDPAMIARLAGQGFRTILNLRGATEWGAYVLEREACRAAGTELIDFKLNSRVLPQASEILELDRIFATAGRPMLMHCKSGADRAGFASALYLLLRTGASADEAKKQLSWRYLHFGGGRTGVLIHMLERFGASGMGFRDWLAKGYDPQALMAEVSGGRAGAFLTDRVLRRE